jgi:glycosyltransferase involved in cell wall biosynthesis
MTAGAGMRWRARSPAGRLRIAQVAPLYESVPPRLYGGTERVVAHLCDALVERGHEVTLFASGDSRTRARLVAPIPRALRMETSPPDPIAAHMISLGGAFDPAGGFDVIHCHVDYLAFPFARLTATPTLHTLHGRLDLPYLIPTHRAFRGLPLVSISDAQREPLRALDLHWADTVYHGLPLSEYPFSASGGDYLAFLGRASPEKRPDLAITAAVRAGVPLKIGAKIDRVDEEYFERDVAPLLGHPLVEFLGEIGGEERVRLLRGARAVLFPIDWPEPFGLVLIEALACGTPVIAFRRGSVPEIIDNGQTGFIVDTLDGMIRAIRRVDRLDRRACREAAERRFTVDAMVDAYERSYTRLLARARTA